MQKEARVQPDDDQLLDFLTLTSERQFSELPQGPSIEQLVSAISRAGALRRADKATLARLDHALRRGYEYRREVLEHPVVKWLNADDRFRKARSLFVAECKRAKARPLADLLAEFRFLHIVAITVTSYIAPGVPRRRSTLRNDESALKHAKTLVKLMDQGVRLREGQDNKLLRNHLDDLVQEFQSRKPKKSGPNQNAPQQNWVRWLVRRMNDKFGAADPKLIIELAAMIGYELDTRTLGWLIKAP